MDDPMPDWLAPCWRVFLAGPQHLDGNGTCARLWEGDLMPLQRRSELGRVLEFVRRTLGFPNVVMEIGTDKGGTFYHWIRQGLSLRKAIAVEPRGMPYKESLAALRPEAQFLWLEESSETAGEKVRQFLGDDEIKLLFIDGDKGRFGEDFDLYAPLVNGTVLFHDVFDNGSPMQEAFRSRAAGYHKTGVIIDTSDCDRQKERDVLGIVDSSPYAVWLRHWMHTSCGFGWIDTRSKLA